MSNLSPPSSSSSSFSSSSSSDASRSGLEAKIPPSISSLIESLCSENFGNLIVAADNLAKEQHPAKIGVCLADKLKSLPKEIRKTLETFTASFYMSVKGRGMMQRADAKKLWRQVESDLSIAMTLCDQLTDTFQHLAPEVRDADYSDDDVQDKLWDSYNALTSMQSHLTDICCLILPEITFREILRTSNVIVAAPHDKFRKHLYLTRISNTLTVFLFHLTTYSSYRKTVKEYIEISEQYHYEHGEDKIKFVVAKMPESADVFKVKEFPTVVVMKGDKKVGRVSIADVGFHSAVFMGLQLILDRHLAEDDTDCGY